MKKYILFLIAFHLLLSFNSASAEIKTFVKEYTYQASDLDSRNSCRAIATEQLKRALLEELGTYVQSKTVVKDNLLDKDEITTLTAGVVQVVVMDEKWDGKVYWLEAQVKADPDEVAASIDKLKNDEHLVHDLEEARAEAAAYISRSIVYVQLGRYGRAANDLKMAAALNPGREEAYYTRVELKKRARDLKVGVNRQNKAPIQGARFDDPLQKLLNWKKEEKKKASLRRPQEKSIPIHTESSRNTTIGASSNKETGRSQLGKSEKNNQSLRKERDLRRKQRVEEIRKKAREGERDRDK